MKTSPLVLIIDDERKLVRSLELALKEAGVEARGAFDGASGLKLAAEIAPDAVLLDLKLPDLSGVEVLEALKKSRPDCPVIMISAHGDTRAAVQCVKAGASDYLTKPFDLDELVHLIGSTLERRQVAEELAYRRALGANDALIVGEHPATQRLRQQVARVAMSGARTILLLGASGTGKAVVARAIHQDSERCKGPFVEVNCASLPEQLLEAELFGAEKGAYTGAHQRRVGLVTLADRGTLFLDEIGELAPPLQAKLLSFLENRTYRALGSGREAAADVRVVAATNRDLSADVRSGRFREDLYYRLNVFPVELPPLKDRGDDVFLLMAHFAERFAHDEGCEPIRLGEEARELFRAHPWPGNVRELRNLVERLTILHPGQMIEPGHLPPEMKVPGANRPDAGRVLPDQLAAAERDLLLEALTRARGQKGRAAQFLGISRHALKRRLKRLNLD
ncbi:MAG: sigma-54-dependent Fis family transcriptional regulator [Betaproteobacteria bacterium]|nr:sigma-54-dependent Fis family transcriptional regulator [Betaproteobacteria bacterium]